MKTGADELLNAKVQAAYAAERIGEQKSQDALKQLNEYQDEWQALSFRFSGWAKRAMLGDDLPGYPSDEEFAGQLIRLIEVTKKLRGPASIAGVSGFDASRYDFDEDDKTRLLHALAVRWIIVLLVDIDDGCVAVDALEAAKQRLTGYGEFELRVIASRLFCATYVIQMAETARDCPICKEPMPVGQFDSERCSDCVNQANKRDAQDNFVERRKEFLGLLPELEKRCQTGKELRDSITAVATISKKLTALQKQIWQNFKPRMSSFHLLLQVRFGEWQPTEVQSEMRIFLSVGDDPFSMDSHDLIRLGRSIKYSLRAGDDLIRWNEAADRIKVLLDQWKSYCFSDKSLNPISYELAEAIIALRTERLFASGIPEIAYRWIDAGCPLEDQSRVERVVESFADLESSSNGILAMIRNLIDLHELSLKDSSDGQGGTNTNETESNLADIEAETPPLDKKSIEWIAAREKNKNKFKLPVKTLREYRAASKGGRKTANEMLGIDADGRIWRRKGTPKSQVFYYAPSLPRSIE